MKNNFEWVVPVIVAVVFIVGNILRILNWRNEQVKKAARRVRDFQPPQRTEPAPEANPESATPLVVEPVYPSMFDRPVDLPSRPLGNLEKAMAARQKARAAVLSEDVQKAIRRNRAKAQKKAAAARPVVEEVIVPVVLPASTRQTRGDAPPPPTVVVPEGGPPAATAQAMTNVVADLFKSPDSVARALVLQVIFSPPLCRRGPQAGIRAH
jgi:hypothetical protein